MTANKYGKYGLVSHAKKGGYTPQARRVLATQIKTLKSLDPAANWDTVSYYNDHPTDKKLKKARRPYTTAELFGLAERLDAIGIYVGELPETWVKGTLHKVENGKHLYCLMGYSESCRVKIAKFVDFDEDTWKGVSSERFNTFASNWSLVSLNDAYEVDVLAFQRFIRRTAVALREYAQAIEAGKKRTWEQCVDAAFWRQRKTLGLVGASKAPLAEKKGK